tara:strand:+ start:594 stop:1403 length:810 start_codon:yes stop_codon:yes gene_type:complete
MPELPEVESIRRQLEPLLMGKKIISSVESSSPKFFQAKKACDHVISRVDRRGKYLLIRLEKVSCKRDLVIHLGMTGSLQIGKPHTNEPHLRAQWTLEDGLCLLFRDIRMFGRVSVVNQGDYQSFPTLNLMGPEPFDPLLNSYDFYSSLASSRQKIKTKLLSQRPIAGIGNIYADEALWRARINPVIRRISPERASSLLRSIQQVLLEALRYGGTTLRDYQKPDGSFGRNQNRLICYGKAGKPCQACKEKLQFRLVDQRSTTWCPTCQKY